LQIFRDIADFLSDAARMILVPVLVLLAFVLLVALVDRHSKK
jgi:hypothetical protein